MNLKIVYNNRLRVNINKVSKEIQKHTSSLFKNRSIYPAALDKNTEINNFKKAIIEKSSPEWKKDIVWAITWQPLFFGGQEVNGIYFFQGKTSKGKIFLKNEEIVKLAGFINLRGWSIEKKLKHDPRFLAKSCLDMLLSYHYGWEKSHTQNCFHVPRTPEGIPEERSVSSQRNEREFCSCCQKKLESLTKDNIFNFVKGEKTIAT